MTASAIDLTDAREIIGAKQPVVEADLIPLLQDLQDAYGYLPQHVLECVAEETVVPLSRVVGAVTFYEQFSLTPRGRHIIRVCRGTACHVRGGGRIAAAVKSCLGVGEGETTPDMQFSFYTLACLGTCFLAPAMMVDNYYYGRLTPGKVGPILDQYKSTKSARKVSNDDPRLDRRTRATCG